MKRGLYHGDCLEDNPVLKNADISMVMIALLFFGFLNFSFSL